MTDELNDEMISRAFRDGKPPVEVLRAASKAAAAFKAAEEAEAANLRDRLKKAEAERDQYAAHAKTWNRVAHDASATRMEAIARADAAEAELAKAREKLASTRNAALEEAASVYMVGNVAAREIRKLKDTPIPAQPLAPGVPESGNEKMLERVAQLRIETLNAKYAGKEFTIPASETMEILNLAMNALSPLVTPEMWMALGRIKASAEPAEPAEQQDAGVGK